MSKHVIKVLRLEQENDPMQIELNQDIKGDMSELCAPSNRHKENQKLHVKGSKAKNWGKAKADMMHNKATARIDRADDRRQARRAARAERSRV